MRITVESDLTHESPPLTSMRTRVALILCTPLTLALALGGPTWAAKCLGAGLFLSFLAIIIGIAWASWGRANRTIMMITPHGTSFRTSSITLGLEASCFALAAAAFLWGGLASTDELRGVLIFLGIASSLATLAGAAVVMCPPGIQLSPQGLTIWRWWRTPLTVAWADIDPESVAGWTGLRLRVNTTVVRLNRLSFNSDPTILAALIVHYSLTPDDREETLTEEISERIRADALDSRRM